MNKIIEKTYELIDALDESLLIKELSESKEELLQDVELLKLIEQAKKSSDNEQIEIKKQLYNNPIYKNYMDNYNKLFYIILDINHRLKKITNTTNCSK